RNDLFKISQRNQAGAHGGGTRMKLRKVSRAMRRTLLALIAALLLVAYCIKLKHPPECDSGDICATQYGSVSEHDRSALHWFASAIRQYPHKERFTVVQRHSLLGLLLPFWDDDYSVTTYDRKERKIRDGGFPCGCGVGWEQVTDAKIL